MPKQKLETTTEKLESTIEKLETTTEKLENEKKSINEKDKALSKEKNKIMHLVLKLAKTLKSNGVSTEVIQKETGLLKGDIE